MTATLTATDIPRRINPELSPQGRSSRPSATSPGGDFFLGAQFSRELARLYEYSYRPCAVCLLPNFVLCCNRRLVREVSRESKQV